MMPASYRLILSRRQRVTIERHGATTYPEECCGVLIGRALAADGSGTRVERVVAATNEREDSRHNRYVIPPQVVMAATKEARSQGLDVVGFYHSHPDHPAEPSDFDREHAWPGLTYLIVSVREGRPVDLRAWRLTDDRERFEEERVEEPSEGDNEP